VRLDRICGKCGHVKKHSRVHHCSRCGRCVEYMDHHCTFADNCIAKGNVRFFVQFTSWVSGMLLVSLIHMTSMFYRQNYLDTGKGATNFYHILSNTPMSVRVHFMDIIFLRYDWYKAIDSTLVIACTIFFFIAFMNLNGILHGVRTRSSSIIEYKVDKVLHR
jgi:hypothetical protein